MLNDPSGNGHGAGFEWPIIRVRVIDGSPYGGSPVMQVCAVLDATDEEILKTCNSQDELKSHNDWTTVMRDPDKFNLSSNWRPVECGDAEKCGQGPRLHIFVIC